MLSYEFIDPEKQIESDDFKFIESFLKSTRRTQIGWHYIIDLVWIYSRVKEWPKKTHVLDAGGGRGPLQFLLAEMGMDVTNIDLLHREPSAALQKRYEATLKILPSLVQTSYSDHVARPEKQPPGFLKSHLKSRKMSEFIRILRYNRWHDRWKSAWAPKKSPVGKIKWIAGNLSDLPEVADGTFDAVVSLSAVEHIPVDQLGITLETIHRVIKPDARWALTTSGTEQSNTWYHQPSKGLCFSETDLKNIFHADPRGRQDPSDILEKYRTCDYLKENLAKFYFESDKYGMPLGIWDPKYIPVGLAS